MGYLTQFKIPFAGLALGDHRFDYTVDNQFFEQFENSVIQKADLRVVLTFNKQETMLLLGFTVEGTLDVICDRCADEFAMPVADKWELIIKLGDEEKELSDNMVMINRNAHEINVAQYIYEFISLLPPQKIVHPDDSDGNSTCDLNTLKAISELETKAPQADPRWEVLKKLKIK